MKTPIKWTLVIFILLAGIGLATYSPQRAKQKPTINEEKQEASKDLYNKDGSLVSSPGEAKSENEVSYRIETKETNKTLWASFDVRLEKSLTKEQIEKIAYEIKRENPGFQEYTMSYYLPEMTSETGSWAISRFKPNLSIQIFGIGEAETAKLKDASLPGGDIIGKWYDSRTSIESTIIIYKENNKHKVRQIYSDGSFGDRDVKKIGSKFIYPNDFGEFFKIEEDGNLGWYSKNGRFALAKKLK